MAIPDNSLTGIERTLVVNDAGNINEVEVSVDITHTFIGDLNVALVSPAEPACLCINAPETQPTTSSKPILRPQSRSC